MQRPWAGTESLKFRRCSLQQAALYSVRSAPSGPITTGNSVQFSSISSANKYIASANRYSNHHDIHKVTHMTAFDQMLNCSNTVFCSVAFPRANKYIASANRYSNHHDVHQVIHMTAFDQMLNCSYPVLSWWIIIQKKKKREYAYMARAKTNTDYTLALSSISSIQQAVVTTSELTLHDRIKDSPASTQENWKIQYIKQLY